MSLMNQASLIIFKPVRF